MTDEHEAVAEAEPQAARRRAAELHEAERAERRTVAAPVDPLPFPDRPLEAPVSAAPPPALPLDPDTTT